jgi:hypothetical protein
MNEIDEIKRDDLKKYAYKITYDTVVSGNTFFIAPKIQTVDYHTLEPIIDIVKSDK